MNLILLFPDDFIDENRVRLHGRRVDHIRQIHRASEGDELRVGAANGKIGTGTILLLSRDSVEVAVSFAQDPPEPVPITLIAALPRPKILRRILRSVTALGIKKIVLLNSARVEKSYWQTPFLTEHAIREQLVLGLEQSRDTILPEVALRPLFKPFVEDDLPFLLRGTAAFLAHPGAPGSCPREADKPITLVIGPEGGFIPYEVDKLIAAGCEPVSMGARILPVETAIPALVARLL